MAYKYKVTAQIWLMSVVSLSLDIFILPLIIMEVWNHIVTDVVNLRNITYIEALAFKFGCSALSHTWFSDAMYVHATQQRFDNYADMISTRILQVTNELKARYPTDDNV